MFQVDDYGFAFDDDGKVSLVLYLNISCYFANRSGSVNYSAPPQQRRRIPGPVRLLHPACDRRR